MKTEKFWFGWLKIAAVVCTLFGVVMALFNQTGLFIAFNTLIENVFYTDVYFDSSLVILQQWIIGILGATMAGWGLLMLFVVKYAIQNREKWAWNAMVISLIVWFTIDSFVSAHFGAYFNVVINVILFLQFFAPLLALRKSMKK